MDGHKPTHRVHGGVFPGENDGNTIQSIGFQLEPFIDGKPIPGFTMEEYVELYGDEVGGEVRWKDGSE